MTFPAVPTWRQSSGTRLTSTHTNYSREHHDLVRRFAHCPSRDWIPEVSVVVRSSSISVGRLLRQLEVVDDPRSNPGGDKRHCRGAWFSYPRACSCLHLPATDFAPAGRPRENDEPAAHATGFSSFSPITKPDHLNQHLNFDIRPRCNRPSTACRRHGSQPSRPGGHSRRPVPQRNRGRASQLL
jgi:hypothetical protein